MWAYTLSGPRTLELISVETPIPEGLAADAVLVKVLVGGICGSDIPFYRGRLSPLLDMTGETGGAGFSLHEVVGEVVAAGPGASLSPGARVVGWAAGSDGLAEHVVTPCTGLLEYDPGLDPIEAIALQPLACVLHTLGRLPNLRGAQVAVLGLGPIGLMFAHAAKDAGAARVVGVDPVDRTAVAARFGVDEAVRQTSDRWAAALSEADRPDVVIEAVGHQVGTLTDAVQAISPGGTIFYFGVPDDMTYPVPFYALFRKSVTLVSGAVTDRFAALRVADAYARRHPALLSEVVSHVFPVSDAAAAFAHGDIASPTRLKVVIDYRDGLGG